MRLGSERVLEVVVVPSGDLAAQLEAGGLGRAGGPGASLER